MLFKIFLKFLVTNQLDVNQLYQEYYSKHQQQNMKNFESASFQDSSKHVLTSSNVRELLSMLTVNLNLKTLELTISNIKRENSYIKRNKI